MNILVPAALAFLLIIPVILLLYFMRPKRQERVIGSTFLWQQALQNLQASQPWQRLRLTPLLLLQLLAALIIVLVLIRPAIFTGSAISGNTIIILQASASMQATDVTPNRFENAKETIGDFIDSMGPADTLSLITMARTPRVLAAASSDHTLLHTMLNTAHVTNQDADMEQALSLALSLAAAHSNTQIVVVGDGHVINPDQGLVSTVPVRYLPIGTDTPNTALLSLAARNVRGKMVASAQIANYSHQSRAVPVVLYGDGQRIGVQTVMLAAGANGTVQWSTLPPATRFLHAQLLTQDAMKIDHDAWTIVGSAQRGRALVVTKGNIFLTMALKRMPNIDLYETTPDKYSDTGTYDLTIFDSYLPPTLPKGDLFVINPPVGVHPFGTSGQDISVSRIRAVNDPANLLNDVDLSSIHVLRQSRQLKPATWAQTIISTPETPLLIAGENNNQRIAVLGFDLHNSDFPLQPTFPVLIYNLTNWFLPPPVPGDAQVTPGLPITIQTWPGSEQVSVTTPDKHSVTVGPPFPTTPFSQTDQVGIYQVMQRVRGQTQYGAFAVNLFNPGQSQLTPAIRLPIVHSINFNPRSSGVSRQLREIWPWIAAILLLVLAAEWLLFSRHYRQQAAPHTGTGTLQQRGKSSPTSSTRLARLQQQWQHTSITTRKRWQKSFKRARATLTRQTAKGRNRGNI